MHNRSYCMHNFLWVLLSPIGILITFIMYEFDVNLLRWFPSADIIFSSCMDMLFSTFCLSLFFWLFVKYIVKSARSTFRYGVVYFILFYLIHGLFVLSDAIIFSKEIVEQFLNELDYFSANSSIENFEKQKELRDLILIFGFFLLDTLISSTTVFFLKSLKLFPILTPLPKE